MDHTLYIIDQCTQKLYVLTTNYVVLNELEVVTDNENDTLLPPELKIKLIGITNIQLNFNSRKHKYIYICDEKYFKEYTVVYMKGMKYIYCIKDERFKEKEDGTNIRCGQTMDDS